MNMKKTFFLALGFLGLGLGAVGAVVPLLPAFPFLLLAAVSFAKSSQRLHTWFVNTGLYKKNLESYVQGRGMTRDAKRRVMLTVTAIMAVSAGIMLLRGVYWPCLILAAVWAFHILYFLLRVKTLQEENRSKRVEATTL